MKHKVGYHTMSAYTAAHSTPRGGPIQATKLVSRKQANSWDEDDFDGDTVFNGLASASLGQPQSAASDVKAFDNNEIEDDF
jgi:hypothetical protein